MYLKFFVSCVMLIFFADPSLAKGVKPQLIHLDEITMLTENNVEIYSQDGQKLR